MPKKKRGGAEGEPAEKEMMDNPLAASPATPARDFDIMDEAPSDVEPPAAGAAAPQPEPEPEPEPEPAADVVDTSVLEARVDRLEQELESKTEKLTRMETMQAMSTSERLLEYEKLVQRKDGELETIRRDMFIDAKAHPSKKQRSKITKVIKGLAERDGLHQSPNTVQTIIDLERRNADNEDPSINVQYVWAFVFDIPQDGDKFDVGDAEVLSDGEDPPPPPLEEDAEPTSPRSPENANANVRISHEAWMACEKIVTADLCLRHAIPIDGKSLIIAIGAPHDVLVDEAQQMKLLMRMQETKGTMEFHQDLLRYYATNHGGLNEYIPGPPTGPDGEPLENYPTDDYHQGPHLRQREPAMLEQHWKYDEELSAEELEQRQMRAQSVFSSSIAQRLVMSRLVRLGRYDPDHQMQLAAKDTKGLPADRRALGHVSNRSVVKHRDIPASLLHDLLTLFGGYRPQNQAVFPMARGEPVIAHLAKQVQADDQFILKTSGLDSHKKSSAGAPDALTYDHVVDCVSILERWRDGRGRKEIWFGTLAAYFPLHLENELKYLKNEWGNPKMLFSGSIIGYNPEGEPKERVVEGEEPELEHNTLGAAKNRLQVHRFPLSLVYQPIEEIRDYFGDDVGLYFSWLGVYTKALFVMSLTGLVVMGVQPYASDCDFFGCGVARNPLTVYYTIYVGIWSTLFIESWHRRENELRFLWGTEKLSQIEQPRPAFVGELDTNPETGRQLLVVKSPAEQYMKIFLSTLMSVGFIIFTVASAIAAQMVKYIEPDGEGLLEQKKYEMAAAALNLAIIAIYGSLFEKLADALTEWENHRTQSEFDNSRVGKNFLFQFVNNYFVLFYISYLREIKDPISKAAHPCQYGNCLPELQVQLIVVFTGKTLGKQFAYTLKPFIYKWKKQCKDNSMTKSIVKNASKGTSMMPASMKSAMDQVGNLAEGGGQGDPRHQLKALKNVRNPYELQARLMPYQGTFADFNDRVIQFGYLVLFAPAFPLAPFLAFVNNVIEIRTSGFKMCFAYQRPKWRARSGIGSWLAVMNVLGFLAVITNASMITFVGDQDAKSNNLCAVEAVPYDDPKTEDVQEDLAGPDQLLKCPVMYDGEGVDLKTGEPIPPVYVDPDSDGMCYGCSGFLNRSQEWQLWLQFAITEHAILLLRVIILSLAPSMPKWISDAREVLEYRMANRYLTAEHLEAERRQQEEYNQKMNDSLAVMKRQLRFRTEDDLLEMFNEQDQDHSGAIDDRELKGFFASMNIMLSEKEVKNAMKDIDEGGDGTIGFQEMLDWMISKGLWHPDKVGLPMSPTGDEMEAEGVEEDGAEPAKQLDLT